MASQRPHSPSGTHHSVPTPHDPAHISRGYGQAPHMGVDEQDFAATPDNPGDPSPLSQTLQPSNSQRHGRFEEDFDARTRGSSILDGDAPQRSASRASTALNQGAAPSRSGTLKKRSSVKRSASLKRSGSRRSAHAGSIRGVSVEDDERGNNSVFYTPVPTSGAPTDVLANRFQAWRKLLKDLITYFREVATSYEHRAKSLLKVSNVINNTNAPTLFMTEGGLNDANRLMRDFHKQSISEANKAKDIETEVINQLSGLRADLGQKIKEIKSLSGDFKNSVEKEKETTRKCVAALGEALALVDSDPSAVAGKGDPYVIRLGVDRQVERQIDEENYLHRAYLNLENSGRELESIVVGEVQKAYNALANIMKHEADELYSTVERLRSGPIGMPRDLEWNQFVQSDKHFVNPNIPLRRLEEIEYPGKHHPATTEVRAGMLERKSKYLKSYTPGWYVLSPTHLHEFKSADRIYTQPPVMSLYLPDQKLGSHSQPGSSSHKFVLKGRQTGSMHRGHTWVFRAETYDTMLAWYEDIKNLTEKSGEERDAFVRRHVSVRSRSQSSVRSVSSDGALDEDEADQVPYAHHSISQEAVRDESPKRPSPGGRFPSDIQLDRNSQGRLSPSSGSSEVGHDLTTASGFQGGYPYPTQHNDYNDAQAYDQNRALQDTSAYQNNYDNPEHYEQNQAPQNPSAYQSNAEYAFVPQQQYQTQTQTWTQTQTSQLPDPASDYYQSPPTQAPPPAAQQSVPNQVGLLPQVDDADLEPLERHNSTYGDWMAPAAGGVAAGALGTAAYQHHQQHQEQEVRPQYSPEYSPGANQPVSTHSNAGEVPISQTTISSLPIRSPPEDTRPKNPGNISNDLAKLDVSGGVPVLSSMNGALNGIGGTAGTAMYDSCDTPIPPTMRRQNTDFTISDLHVPGEYPRASTSERTV